jgi:choline dehydrogenase-like flavoprotein
VTAVRDSGDAAYTDGTAIYRPRDERVVRGSELTGRVRMRADVCVVGTGAGGAVVAYELAAAGLNVVMLEEGELLRSSGFTARPRDLTPRFFRDGGQTVTLGDPPIALPLGKAVGGTTIINSATCYRPPAALLERWGLWSAAELEPHLRRVERIYGVAQIPRAVAGRNAHLMERGAQALGWSGEYLHRAARGCIGSGVCAVGCPTGGKQHTANTYVPRAWDEGAVLVTGARATRVVNPRAEIRSLRKVPGSIGRSRVGSLREVPGSIGRSRVEARTAGGGRLRVEADLVVVACGTVGTPALLHRSGIRHPDLGRNLSIHPATGVWADFDEEVRMSEGVPQAYAVDEFAADGIMLEGWTGPPDLLALAQPHLAPRWPTMAQAGLMIRDDSRGRVHVVGGRPVVRYDVNADDTRKLNAAIRRAAELELAAGATQVHLPITGAAPVRSADAVPEARARDLMLTAFHPLGTAAAGRVVDRDLMLAEGLMVADGSVVPGALGVNPQQTIMALATRAARTYAGAGTPHEPPSATVGRAPSLAV